MIRTLKESMILPWQEGSVRQRFRATGWLADRLERGFAAVDNLYGSLWWHGSMWGYEHVARWVRNVALYEGYSGQPYAALREVTDELIGLVENGRASPDYSQQPLAAYNEEELLMGLLAYWRHTNSPRVLAAARKVGDSIVAQHPSLAGNHYYKSLAIGPLVALYDATADSAYLAAAEAIAANQQLALLRIREGVHGASASMILVGHLALFARTGTRQYLEWALMTADAVRARMFVTGGIGEMLNFTAPESDSSLHDETCQHSWWMLANLALWRVTGESRYLDLVERIFYNHFLSSQLHRGEDGGFCALGDVDQGFRGQHNYICCDNEGWYGLMELLRHAITVDTAQREVTVNLLLPMEVEAPLAGQRPIRIRIDSDYPVRGRVRVQVAADRPESFSLRLRIPGGVCPAGVYVNGEGTACPVVDGHVVVTRTWEGDERVDLTFPMSCTVAADNTGAGAVSAMVRIDGQDRKAKRIGVLHGPVVAALFRCGHGNDLSWVWNGDYPEALDSGGCVFMEYPASKRDYLGSSSGTHHTGGAPALTNISTAGGVVRLHWEQPLGPAATIGNDVEVFPGLPVTMEWRQTVSGARGSDRLLLGGLRYATAKRTRNQQYGTYAFPYPFPAVTTRDDLRANNAFIAGGGSFSLAEALVDAEPLAKTGTVRLSNGSFRAITHYDPQGIEMVVAKVQPDWAGVYMMPLAGANPTVVRFLVFPLYAEPLGQDVTRHELERSRHVTAVLARDTDGSMVVELSGPTIRHLPVFIPRSSGAQAGWLLQDRAHSVVLAAQDGECLVARLCVPGRYRVIQ